MIVCTCNSEERSKNNSDSLLELHLKIMLTMQISSSYQSLASLSTRKTTAGNEYLIHRDIAHIATRHSLVSTSPL